MKKKIVSLLKILVSLALLAILTRKFAISWSNFATGVKSLTCLLMACGLPFTVIPLISVNRWKFFLSCIGIEENFFTLWKINMVSIFQGLVLPSTQGFDVLRMFHLSHRHPNCSGRAAGSVIVERIFGVLVFCAIGLTGLPFVLRYVESKWPIVLGVAGFSLVAVLGTVLVLNKRLHGLYVGRRPKIRILSKIVSFLDSTHGVLVSFPYRKVMFSSIVLILMFQLSTVLSVYLLFCAYGISLPFYMHMAFYPVIAIIAMMPVTIGGFGVREGAFAYFYSLVGVPAEVSVCVSVANYVVLCLLPAALGGVIWLWGCLAGKR